MGTGMKTEVEIDGWPVDVPPPAEAVAPAAPPRLSVLIAYYGGQDTVAEAVESLLAQTVAPHEIIVCDDGSPDDVRAGLGELLGEVQLLSKPNGGTGSALNAAARVASGDYVLPLDVDDVYEPRRIEAISAVLAARPDVDIVATDALIERGGEVVTTMADINPYPHSHHRMAMLRTCTFLWPCLRRSTLLDAGGLDESLKAIEDWDCWLRLVLAGAVVAYIREPLYRWRLTPGSRSSSNRVAHFEDQVRLTEKALDEGWLTPEETVYADTLLQARQRGLARELAREAVENGHGGARGASLPLLTGAGYDRATRAKAAVTMLSPALASRFLDHRRHSETADPAEVELAMRGFRLPGFDRAERERSLA